MTHAMSLAVLCLALLVSVACQVSPVRQAGTDLRVRSPVEGTDPASLEAVEETAAENAGGDDTLDVPTGPLDFGAIPEAEVATGAEAKLDETLLALVRATGTGDRSALDRVAEQGATTVDKDGLVRVDVTVEEVSLTDAVRMRVEELGGQVTVDFERHVYVLLPIKSIERLANESAVWSMSAQEIVAAPIGVTGR